MHHTEWILLYRVITGAALCSSCPDKKKDLSLQPQISDSVAGIYQNLSHCIDCELKCSHIWSIIRAVIYFVLEIHYEIKSGEMMTSNRSNQIANSRRNRKAKIENTITWYITCNNYQCSWKSTQFCAACNRSGNFQTRWGALRPDPFHSPFVLIFSWELH